MKLSERFLEAFALAYELHQDQIRKGGETSYLAHLLAVASLVIENGGDEDEAIAALLHDAVEDQGGMPTAERIGREFGERVAAIVLGCSEEITKPKLPWRERKVSYLWRLRHKPDVSVRLVSACDKLHNARCILADFRTVGDAVWKRFKGGREGTLWYYRALQCAFAEGGATARERAIVRELDHVVTALEQEARATGGTPPPQST